MIARFLDGTLPAISWDMQFNKLQAFALSALLIGLVAAHPGRASADPPSLLAKSLSLAVPLALDNVGQVDVTALDLEPRPTALSVGARRDAERTFSRRGGYMAAAGIPMAIGGVALSIYAATVTDSTACDEINRPALGAAGGTMAAVGIGLSSAGIHFLRKSSRSARRARSRATRSGIAAVATVSTLGMLTAAIIAPMLTSFCNS
ncbi:MAG: hypothetical protein AAGF92_06560 [Myxococcota bacterium]